MLWIHIAGGSAALLAGFVALYLRKGGGGHRSWGRLFAYAMFVMTISGVLIAVLLRPNPGNVLVAAITFYLVASGWLAVRPGPNGARRRHITLCALAFVAATYGLALAVVAFQAPRMVIKGIPAVAILVFSLVALAGAISDVRLLRGRPVEGGRRLLRHLWRMGLALWIATMSFFFGQADEFPKAVRDTGLLALPVLLVAATLLFWVVRQVMAGRREDCARLMRTAAIPDSGVPG